ncbi:MAG: hypothetical protein QQW96_24080 [Tychonema bourrellyi B0820]|uniref:hypothetical protein n=1 Tax=Tychonema bourrellyi TaxID=54313 RepID=UPI0015D4B078|nr:hypothetical protein [Tychonema bourrellyi]MDQ2100710.1 hypothetical protein [Tychonema bourrellyi B0820]
MGNAAKNARKNAVEYKKRADDRQKSRDGFTLCKVASVKFNQGFSEEIKYFR